MRSNSTPSARTSKNKALHSHFAAKNFDSNVLLNGGRMNLTHRFYIHITPIHVNEQTATTRRFTSKIKYLKSAFQKASSASTTRSKSIPAFSHKTHSQSNNTNQNKAGKRETNKNVRFENYFGGCCICDNLFLCEILVFILTTTWHTLRETIISIWQFGQSFHESMANVC